jgi:polysaccharide biosynthesis/export protein
VGYCPDSEQIRNVVVRRLRKSGPSRVVQLVCLFVRIFHIGFGARPRLLSLVAACGVALLAACSSSVPVVPAEVPQVSATGSQYRIGTDDRIQVSVWRNPELSVTVPVRPDGQISVPLIGDVQAGGMTAPQLAAVIKDKLAAYIRDPYVTVIVTELRSHEFLSRVRVTGAVRTPRSLPYRPGMTVLDVILEAGGVNDFAAPNRTKLYRSGDGKTQVFDISLDDIISRGKLETNMKLVPGDVVSVPERYF